MIESDTDNLDLTEVYNSTDPYIHDDSKCVRFWHPFYKLFFKYPAKLMKLLFQFGEFYFFIELLCFTLQFFVILMTSTARLKKWVILCLFFFFFIFSFLFGHPLTISLWEFVQLRWINNLNPIQTIFDIFEISIDKKHFIKAEFILNFVIGVFFWVYACSIFSESNTFDILNSIVLFFLPCLKLGSIYLCYFIRAFQSLFIPSKIEHLKFKDPFVLSMKNRKFEFFSQIILKNLSPKNDQDSDHDTNCVKCLKKYERMTITKKRYIFMFIKEVGSISGIIYLVFLQVSKNIKSKNMIIPFIIWIYNSILTFSIEMPIWSLNIFNRWDNYFRIINATEGINGEIRKQYRFRGFKYVNTFCTFIIPIIIITYFILINTQNGNTFESISDQTLWNGILTHNYDQQLKGKKTVLSPMCGLGIYHLNLVQIGSIAAASYYDNNKVTIEYYKNSFFRDENIEITKIEHVLKNDNEAVLLRVDFNLKKSSRNLTIFSVRGSTTSIDWWLDFEIFISVALNSVARWFPILVSYESFSAKIISGFMTFPLYSMNKASLTYSYTEKMFVEIQKFIDDKKNVNKSVLFTGHSLGGGLSKILANKFGKQSVSFSGPGISPIEDKFRKKDNYDKFFKAKFIDVVPDNDFVPRFETSAGTKYRVLCEQNGAECHSILRTICQIGVSCGLEYYTGDFCRGRYNKDEYDNMINLANGYKKN